MLRYTLSAEILLSRRSEYSDPVLPLRRLNADHLIPLSFSLVELSP
jgi:hypothetical protein